MIKQKEKQKPFFAESTPREERIMLLCVGSNALLVCFCLAYLAVAFTAVRPGPLLLLIAVVVGYFLCDVASGVVHWATDTWFSERQFGRLIAIAREHHTHPQHILGYRFIELATLGSAPSALVIWPLAVVVALIPPSAPLYVAMIFCFMISLTLLFGTSLHNFGHRKARGPVVRLLQRMRFIITPAHHGVHHMGDQTVRYCTVNGWANYLLDRFRIWRRLEALIEQITGARPRESDVVWQTHFKETGTMLTVPQESRARHR